MGLPLQGYLALSRPLARSLAQAVLPSLSRLALEFPEAFDVEVSRVINRIDRSYHHVHQVIY